MSFRHAPLSGFLLVLCAGCNLFHEVAPGPADTDTGPSLDAASADMAGDGSTTDTTEAMDGGDPDVAVAPDAGEPPWTPPGPVFYVATDGSDDGDGSLEDPWGTFAHAAAQLQPNDTLYIRGGTYEEQLAPVVDGVPGSPIHLRAYPDEEVVIANVTVPLHIEDVAQVHVHGLVLRDPGRRWVDVHSAENIVLEAIVGEVTQPPSDETSVHEGVDIKSSQFITIRGADLSGWRHTDADNYDGHSLGVLSSSYIVIEDGTFGASGNSAVEIIDAQNVVVRDNLIRNPWDSGFYIGRCDSLFIYRNRIVESGIERAGGYGMHVGDSRAVVVRHNQFRSSQGLAARFVGSDTGDRIESIRVAHNTFVGNNLAATWPGGALQFDDWDNMGVDIVDAVVRNNILYLNDPSEGGRENQMFVGDAENPDLADMLVAGNFFSNVRAQACDLRLVEDGDGDGICPIAFEGVGNADVDWMEANAPMKFVGNSEANPKLASVRPGAFDLTLLDDSPAIDAATPLATVVGSGSGTRVTVSDSLYFHGDMVGLLAPEEILIGSQPVGVVTVDRDTGVLTVDREIDYADGDPVSFGFHGDAPDVGALEAL